MQWSPALPENDSSSSSNLSSNNSRSNEQLALMTVGVDRLIRVWVEVRMQDLLPSHLTHPPPLPRGECDSFMNCECYIGLDPTLTHI